MLSSRKIVAQTVSPTQEMDHAGLPRPGLVYRPLLVGSRARKLHPCCELQVGEASGRRLNFIGTVPGDIMERRVRGVIGAGAGFCIGVLAWTGTPAHLVGVPSPAGWIIFAVAGTLGGAALCAYGGNVTRWGVGTAATVGAIAFLAGFVGPIVLHPDSPQGPLFGIFVTGPWGVIVGALIGAVIGASRNLSRGREPD